ncbi:MAG: hypothetical protein JW951_09130 [Lentisphaerae bacterium]|nr:hypothetical protein [Lentisphaerota bacterium]
MTHPYATDAADYRLEVAAGAMTVSADSAVDASGRGYRQARTAGNTAEGASTGCSGGSYGGAGGTYDGTANAVYGAFRDPLYPGSGGAGHSRARVHGGGCIRLTADTLMLEGCIRADGRAAGNYQAGGGSGGGIRLDVGVLRGGGRISADGGAGCPDAWSGGGGGGRVAVYYAFLDGFDAGRIRARGARGRLDKRREGTAGTVFLKPAERPGCLIVDGWDVGSTLALSVPCAAFTNASESLTVAGTQTVVRLDPGAVCLSNVTLCGGAVLTCPASTTGEVFGLDLTLSGTLTLGPDARLDVTGLGYRQGYTVSNTTAGGSTGESGGSYGGRGGNRRGTSNATYGDPRRAMFPGSGGFGHVKAAVHGGGRIGITARAVVLDGVIAADGRSPKGAYAGGGGSGGGVYLRTGMLSGGGSITARGADGSSIAGGAGGGGGRIAVFYDVLDPPSVTNRFDAGGGAGNTFGEAGTVYVWDLSQPDRTGPALTNLCWDGGPLPAAVERSGVFSVTAGDPVGVSRVVFRLNGAALGTSAGWGPVYTRFWNAAATAADGPHALEIRAYDTLDNVTVLCTNVLVALAVPEAPVLTAPENGLEINTPAVAVAGTAGPCDSAVLFVVNGAPAGVTAVPGPDGAFSAYVPLAEGSNAVCAMAANRAGNSAPSAPRTVVVNSAVPDPPFDVHAEARPAGCVRVAWWAPVGVPVARYDVWRAETDFVATGEAVRVGSVAGATRFTDLAPEDGPYTYRVAAVNRAGTVSPLSEAACVAADATPPRALLVAAASAGPHDAAGNRFGPGAVDLTVTVSEPLTADPFLTVVPCESAPVAVPVVPSSDTVYRGVFRITELTPPGTAYLNFAGYDMAGNRGTEINAGGTLIVDNRGPAVQTLSVAPAAPVKNAAEDPTVVTVTVAFAAGDAPAEAPALSWTLSHTQPDPQPVALHASGSAAWTGSLTLPSGAGDPAEWLGFAYRGLDALGNAGTEIAGPCAFQVYRGALPPPDPPSGLTARALPGGAAALTWHAVEGADDYRIYRGAVSNALAPHALTGGAANYAETAEDGTYWYAVAAVRTAHGDTAESAACVPVPVTADGTPPDAPVVASMRLEPTGLRVAWRLPDDPAALVSRLYRDSGPIDAARLPALVPVAEPGPETWAADPAPLPGPVWYAVTACDPAGNESPPSASVYTNLSLLPVRTLTVERTGRQPPRVAWTHAAPSHIDGFDLYVGEPGEALKVNTALLSPEATAFTDTGYDGGERRYVVEAVDAAGGAACRGQPRAIRLPRLEAGLRPDAALKRGVMNRLVYDVTNAGARTVCGIGFEVRAGGRRHTAAPFDLAPGAARAVSVVVGGYTNLPGALTTVSNRLVLTPHAGERAAIGEADVLEVVEDRFTAALRNTPFTRGGTGCAAFTLYNTCSVTVETVVARGNGAAPSDEVRFKLEDAAGAVYAVAPLRECVGGVSNRLWTLPGGTTVARVAPGASFTCGDVVLDVPTNAPEAAVLRLEIDRVHYRYGTEEQVTMAGLTGTREIGIVQTPYTAAVTNVTPACSLGDEPVFISGRTADRRDGTAAPDATLRLVIERDGFERAWDLVGDGRGEWRYVFRPEPGESGVYNVWAMHPDRSDRPVQGAFTISRVDIAPREINLEMPVNYPQRIPVRIAASAGLALTDVRLEYRPEDQPDGCCTAGITVEPGAGVPRIDGGGEAVVAVTVWGDNTATNRGRLMLAVTSAEAPAGGWGRIELDYAFSPACAVPAAEPGRIDTGVAAGGRISESLVLRNLGSAALENVRTALRAADGAAVPAWAGVQADRAPATLGAGHARRFSLVFAPTNGTPAGETALTLRVTADNAEPLEVPVRVAVDGSGAGGVIFDVIDAYYGYAGQDSGVGGARIRLDKQDGAPCMAERDTDADGVAVFADVPCGLYNYHVSAERHEPAAGSLWIKPGVTAAERVFLDCAAVSVAWSVVPVTVEDRYDIVLEATFETDVPVPVLVAAPSSAAVPAAIRVGDVLQGEFLLQNHGLILAESLRAEPPSGHTLFRVELMQGIPETLDPGASVRVPYRATCLALPDGTGSGGCVTYPACIGIDYMYTCASGTQRSGAASFCLTYTRCPVGDESGTGPVPEWRADYGYTPGQGPGGVPEPDGRPKPLEGTLCAPPPEACPEKDPCPCEERKEAIESGGGR